MVVPNKLTDLNNILFEQLERLNDDDLTLEEQKIEIQKAKATAGIANQIISNASLAFEAQKYTDEYGKSKETPNMLQIGDNDG